MAFTNGLKSPRDEPAYGSFTSPIRTVSNQYVPQVPSSHAERASLHRRFTTNAVPTLPTLSSFQTPLSPIGQQRRQAAEQQHDMSSSQREAERIKLSRERVMSEFENTQKELLRLEEELQRLNGSGHQSEPTTPPEYRDGTVNLGPIAGRPNRYSLASLTSPPQNQHTGVGMHRNTLSGSHHSLGFFGGPSSSQTPNASLPASHRNSDEEEEEDTYATDLPTVSRRAAV